MLLIMQVRGLSMVSMLGVMDLCRVELLQYIQVLLTILEDTLITPNLPKGITLVLPAVLIGMGTLLK